jgi:acetyltransferase-like isoleucine patch superfamily enzyme
MQSANSDINIDIFERFLAGEAIPMDDPQYSNVREAVHETFQILNKLNATAHTDDVRKLLSKVIDQEIDSSTSVFPPFYTNYGKNITLGKGVFINHACSFLDLGGITIEDDVMIAPRVNITSENHPVEVSKRKTLVPGKVTIKKNAWIGAGASILPGVTIGKNSVVAAGAVVSKDVPDNTVVGGIPAKTIKDVKP